MTRTADNKKTSAGDEELPPFDGSIADYLLTEDGRLLKYVNGVQTEADISELAGSMPKRTFDLK